MPFKFPFGRNPVLCPNCLDKNDLHLLGVKEAGRDTREQRLEVTLTFGCYLCGKAFTAYFEQHEGETTLIVDDAVWKRDDLV